MNVKRPDGAYPSGRFTFKIRFYYKLPKQRSPKRVRVNLARRDDLTLGQSPTRWSHLSEVIICSNSCK